MATPSLSERGQSRDDGVASPNNGQKSRSKYAPGAIVGQPPGGSGSINPQSSLQRVKPSVMTPDFEKKQR